MLLLLLLLLLGVRVPVTAWPRRARVLLVLLALEQSSDSTIVVPCPFFCCAIGHVWKPTQHARALECCPSSPQEYKNSKNGRTSAARIEFCSSAAGCCCCSCCCCYLLRLLSARVLVSDRRKYTSKHSASTTFIPGRYFSDIRLTT